MTPARTPSTNVSKSSLADSGLVAVKNVPGSEHPCSALIIDSNTMSVTSMTASPTTPVPVAKVKGGPGPTVESPIVLPYVYSFATKVTSVLVNPGSNATEHSLKLALSVTWSPGNTHVGESAPSSTVSSPTVGG